MIAIRSELDLTGRDRSFRASLRQFFRCHLRRSGVNHDIIDLPNEPPLKGRFGMNARVRQAFEAYLELGPTRTLAQVSQLRTDSGRSLPLPTLKRWSSRFHWQSLVQHHDQVVAQAVVKKLGQVEVARRLDDLAVVRELKLRFLQRAMLDPDDPRLTPKERQRALSPNLRDFAMLIQLERQLTGSGADSVDHSASELSSTGLPSEEMLRLAREQARLRYGLPDEDMLAMRALKAGDTSTTGPEDEKRDG